MRKDFGLQCFVINSNNNSNNDKQRVEPARKVLGWEGLEMETLCNFWNLHLIRESSTTLVIYVISVLVLGYDSSSGKLMP